MTLSDIKITVSVLAEATHEFTNLEKLGYPAPLKYRTGSGAIFF
jgi:hypothetical protein